MADERKNENKDRERRTDPDSAEGQFAEQGDAATGRALDGGPTGTGNTGAILPGGAESDFARASGGQTAGLTDGDRQGTPARPTSEWNPGTTDGDPDSGAAQIGTRAAGSTQGPGGGEENSRLTGDAGGAARGQSVGSGAPIGGSPDFLQGSSDSAAAKAQQQGGSASTDDPARSEVETGPAGAGSAPGSLGTGAYGGSVTAAGGSSNVPGAGSAGLERDESSNEGGFIGSRSGGDAESERGERKADKDSDVEGSSSR